jgi:hypothetical protein
MLILSRNSESSRGRGTTMSAIEKLADLMKERKRSGKPPFTLFLGSEPADASGLPEFGSIVDDVLCKIDKSPSKLSITEKPYIGYKRLALLGEAERYSILGEYLWQSTPTRGYRYLAELVKEGYFSALFTTNWDTFLEDALCDVRLRPRKDYAVIFLGQNCEMLTPGGWDTGGLKVKIFKLIDDLSSPKCPWRIKSSMVSKSTWRVLQEYVCRDTILVGHHLQSNILNEALRNACELNQERSLWYVNPVKRPMYQTVRQILTMQKGDLIAGEYGHFEEFFGRLADLLLYRPEAITVKQRVDSVDGEVVGVHIGSVSASSGDSVVISGPVRVGPETPESTSHGDSTEPLNRYQERLESLYRQVEALKLDLDKMQMQAAMYGRDRPARLLNQIASIEERAKELYSEITQLQREVKRHG